MLEAHHPQKGRASLWVVTLWEVSSGLRVREKNPEVSRSGAIGSEW